MVQFIDIIGKQPSIINLTHCRGDKIPSYINTKSRLLEKIQTFIVVKFVAIRRWQTSFLHPLLILNWPNHGLVKYGRAASQSLIHIEDSLSIHASQIEVSHKIWDDYRVKCTFCFQEEQ